MPRPLHMLCAALVVLAGCGASSPVVPEHPAPGTVMQLPRDYGIKCPAAMLARRGGVGGSGIWTDAEGGGITIGGLRFPDEESARRAYAATVSPQAQRCYADGVAAALAQHWGVKVRRTQTRPSKRDGPTTGETTNTLLSVVVAAGGRDVTVSVDSSYVRDGTLFGINQNIDVSALHRGDREVATWLVPALRG